jgi:hypothetical protein
MAIMAPSGGPLKTVGLQGKRLQGPGSVPFGGSNGHVCLKATSEEAASAASFDGRRACFLDAEVSAFVELDRSDEGAAEEFEQHVGCDVLPEQFAFDPTCEDRSHGCADQAVGFVRAWIDSHSVVAREARMSGGRFRTEELPVRGAAYAGEKGAIHGLFSSRLGCDTVDGTLDLAALCICQP